MLLICHFDKPNNFCPRQENSVAVSHLFSISCVIKMQMFAVLLTIRRTTPNKFWFSGSELHNCPILHMTNTKLFTDMVIIFHAWALHNWQDVLVYEVKSYLENGFALQWRHNKHGGVSNHQPHECLLNRLFIRRSRKTSKLRVTGLCEGNSPVNGEFPAQRASNAENVSIWWRHHGNLERLLPGLERGISSTFIILHKTVH